MIQGITKTFFYNLGYSNDDLLQLSLSETIYSLSIEYLLPGINYREINMKSKETTLQFIKKKYFLT